MKQKILNIENEPGFPKMEPGFSVPAGYFDSFGERLQVRMEMEQKVSRPRRILHYLKPVLGIAASLAIILTVYLHPAVKQQPASLATIQQVSVTSIEDQPELVSGAYGALVSDGQFYAALTEMDEYDASKMPKEVLADYLASNCSDNEILNANK